MCSLYHGHVDFDYSMLLSGEIDHLVEITRLNSYT